MLYNTPRHQTHKAFAKFSVSNKLPYIPYSKSQMTSITTKEFDMGTPNVWHKNGQCRRMLCRSPFYCVSCHIYRPQTLSSLPGHEHILVWWGTSKKHPDVFGFRPHQNLFSNIISNARRAMFNKSSHVHFDITIFHVRTLLKSGHRSKPLYNCKTCCKFYRFRLFDEPNSWLFDLTD